MIGKTAFWVLVLAISLYGLKQWSNGCVCENKNRIDGKVALITGGTSGLGAEMAKLLAERGGKIYITCRTEQKGEETAAEIKNLTGVTITPMILDLASVKSVREFAKNFKRKETKLDILVNNAGVFHLDGKTEDGFEMAFGVNHLGHFLLSHLLMDELAASESSRIINLSSSFYKKGYMNWDDINNEHSDMSLIERYGQSKLAIILFTRELAKRLNGTNIATYSLNPGGILTNILRHFYLQGPIGSKITYVVTWPFTKSINAGAQTILCCATDNNMASGKYYDECLEKELSSAAQSSEDALRLWNLSIDMLQMQPKDIHPLVK